MQTIGIILSIFLFLHIFMGFLLLLISIEERTSNWKFCNSIIFVLLWFPALFSEKIRDLF